MSTAASGATSVTSSITRVVTALTSTDARLVKNTSTTVTVYLGDAAVTTSVGFPLAPGESVAIPPGPLEIYGRTSSGTADVRVIGG